MSLNRLVSAISIALGSVAAVSSAAGSVPSRATQSDSTPALYIVQGDSLNTADKSVLRVNAKVEEEFEIIHSVSAYLTPEQLTAISHVDGVRVFENRPVSTHGLLTLASPLTSSLTSTANKVVSATNNAVASSAVGVVTSQVVTPL